MSNKKILLVIGAMHTAFAQQIAGATDDGAKVIILSDVMEVLEQTEEAFNALTKAFEELQKSGGAEALHALQIQFDELQALSVEEIGKLSAELSKAKAIADLTDPGFELDGVDYRVISPEFIYKGKTYTVADLLQDEDLQEELVAKKMGFIVPRDSIKPSED